MLRNIAGAARRIRGRVGRRGTFLLFLTFINLAYGPVLISDPAQILRHYDTTLPLSAWGWLWITGGILHLWNAFRAYDRVSFTVAAAIKSAWAAMYADLTLTQNYPHGWLSVTFWGFFAAVVLVISGWPEPPPANGARR